MVLDPEIHRLPQPLAQAFLQLPVHLQERSRVLPSKQRTSNQHAEASKSISEGPVVYWTHHAQRVDENPALDVARSLAASIDRPLLVYQGLSQSYRYASDRHHLFQLQSARDLSRAYGKMGIRFAVHVETPVDDTRSLLQLAQGASLLVTEDFPGEPTDRWVERLRYLPHLTTVAVDTACVVPMRLVGRAFDRAFAFRDATKKQYADRIDQPWPTIEPSPKPYQGPLPFSPIDLESIDLNDLISKCRIDHGVPPVADTVGGSSAGYERWNAFVAGPLKQYAAKRNDPLSGVASRMSAYLHYGMVSPMRLAREANLLRAEKYLDELLIWRELAYSFCFYRPEFATVRALPHWALQTLKEHETDPRPAIHSWETLSRARTDDRLWNACQESLVRHGELHNNVRMTWGKALLHWTRNATEALELLIDLNHRYALDGRDPASYGGILWCLGQFDRPFTPEQPVLGTVRDRPTGEHAQRMRLDAYEAYVRRPISSKSLRVAMIGAGIAGCMCARTLSDHGVDVTVIEKSRGPGGRCATRRIWEKVLVDHGAPYLEFTDTRWDWLVRSWHQDGVIAPWNGSVVEWQTSSMHSLPDKGTRWVGVGGMNAIGKHLCRDLVCRTQHRVLELEADQSTYRLHVETSDARSNPASQTIEPFDAVVFAIPGEQVRPIIKVECNWLDSIPTQPHVPCWTMMLIFESRWNTPFDAARCSGGTLSWLARESSKPGRPPDPDVWVIQMDALWSAQCIDDEPNEVSDRIIEEIGKLGLPPMPRILHRESHRWRFAQVPSPGLQKEAVTGPDCFWDSESRLGACGDWFAERGVEGALSSGRAMAGRILTWLVAHGPSLPKSAERKPAGGYIQRDLF